MKKQDKAVRQSMDVCGQRLVYEWLCPWCGNEVAAHNYPLTIREKCCGWCK